MEKVLLNAVRNLKGCQFANLIAEVEEKMNKKGNPFYGRVTKIVVTPIQLNYAYQNAVNNRLERQENERCFETEKLPWGEWIEVNKIIAHKGDLYLRTYITKNSKPKFTYMLDGTPMTEEQLLEVKTFFKEKSNFSKKQSECGLEENQVIPKNYKFTNIIQISINGQTIRMR
jgi:hypothetical protein